MAETAGCPKTLEKSCVKVILWGWLTVLWTVLRPVGDPVDGLQNEI